MKKQKYKKGLNSLKALMIPWEWEADTDNKGNVVWDTYDSIVSFIIECRYQLFVNSKFK